MTREALSPRSGRCERARHWVSLRLDGELSELEDALLEKHLEGCASCRSFAGRVAGATALLRETPAERPQLAFEPPARRIVRLPVGKRVAVVAIAAAAALGSLVGSTLQRPAPAPEQPSVPQVSFLTSAQRDVNQLRQLPRQANKTEPAPTRVPGQPPEGVV